MSLIWLRVAALLYGVAALSVLPVALYDRPRWRRLVIPAAAGGLFFHFVSLTEMFAAGLPLLGGHNTQSALAFLLTSAFLLVFLRYRTAAPGVVLLPLTVLLTLAPAFRRASELQPLTHPGWIFFHIALLLAAYAALLLSALASALYLIQERRLKEKRPALRALPPLETADQIARKALLFGLPCMTAGLLVGSVVAEATVGPSFFLDPTVLLSFALGAVYLGMIYMRRQAGLRGRRAVYLSSFVLVVVLAVWAANQFSAVHRFTAP